MANVSITLPAAELSRIVHGLCAGTGQPVEDAAHAKTALLDWIKATVRNVEMSEAQAAMVVPDPTPVTPS